MNTYLWIAVCVAVAGITFWISWTLANNMAEAAKARDLETIRIQKQKTLKVYDDRIAELVKENIKLHNEVDNRKCQIRAVITDRNKLKKAYDIKVASAKGLEIAVKQWHDAYIQLEEEQDAKESEHQSHIDELTQYYQEKLEAVNNE